MSVGDRLASEIKSASTEPWPVAASTNPEARSAPAEAVDLPAPSVAHVSPGDDQSDGVLMVDVPSDEEIIGDVAGLEDVAVGRPDLVLAEAEVVEPDSELVVQTIPVAEDSLPGAVVAFRVRALEDSDDGAWAQLTLDASGFEDAFGADYGDRLRLVEFPECALTEPDRPECVTGHELATAPDDIDGSPSGFVELATPDFPSGGGGIAMDYPDEGTIIAAVSGASGATGTFTATDLGIDSQWAVSEQYGAFTYSVPLQVPTVPVGPSPEITVSYNSGAVDGQGLSTNNQPSWVGQGWGLTTGYVERLYKSCYSDGYVARASELCWDSPIDGEVGEAAYVLSFGGTTQELVWDGGNRYRTASDTGWRITRHTQGAGTNGDDNGEYFKLMTPDGSVYWFGLGSIAETGQASVDTDSVATVPVYGDDAGEPRCPTTGTASSYCMQGYRWMLDRAVDSNENATTYFYTKETNRYAAGGDPAKSVSYTSSITPFAINYGASDGAKITSVQARVFFSTKARCVQTADGSYDELGGDDEDCPAADKDHASSYPDVPLDLRCSGTCTSSQNTPVFYTTKRLSSVNGYIKNTAGNWELKVTHQFEFAYPTTSDGGARALWLDTIQTRFTGSASTTADDVTDYAMAFNGVNLKNRVDYVGSVRSMDKHRITEVVTPEGLSVGVTYITAAGSDNRHCPTGGSSSSAFTNWYSTVQGNWDSNTWDCSPEMFTNSSGSSGFAIFHKYIVDKVVLDDTVMDSPNRTIDYSYIGNPAWGYQNSVLFDRGTGNQTWNSWRGYSQVKVTTGAGGSAESSVLTQYYRGLQGDWQVGGTTRDVTITPFNNVALGVTTTVPDYYSRMGRVVATKTFDGGDIVRKRSQFNYTGATEAYGPDLHDAVWLNVAAAYDFTRIDNANGTFNDEVIGKTTTTYDDAHRVETVLTQPDMHAVTTDQCTKYTYVNRIGSDSGGYFSPTTQPDSGWGSTYYMWAVSQIQTFDRSCTGVATGRTFLYYDGDEALATQKPFDGNVTKEEDYKSETEKDTARATYDSRGRILTATLPDGTSTSRWTYDTDAATGLDVVTFTNAASTTALPQVETTWSDPAFGSIVKVQRANGLYEHYTYDAAGRTLATYAPAQHGLATVPSATVKTTTGYVYDASADTRETRAMRPWVRTMQLENLDANADNLRSYSFFDGFGNEVQSWSVAQDGSGGRSVVTTGYDSVGNVTHVTAPMSDAAPALSTSAKIAFNAATTPAYTYTIYDWAGRPTEVQQKSLGTLLAKTSTTYRGDTTVVASPATTTTTVSDAAGRTLSTTTGETTGAYTKATYAYLVNSDGTTTTTVKDASQKPTVFYADWLGRTTKMTDANAGSTDYFYDANGNVTQVNSPAGTVKTTYDSLRRATSRDTYADKDSSTVLGHTSWSYDKIGTVPAIGQLVKTTTTAGASQYTTQISEIDPVLQRPKKTSVTLPTLTQLGAFSGQTYETVIGDGTTSGYDASGRITQVTVPGVGGTADTVTTKYGPFGVTKLTSSDAGVDILKGVERTFDGRVKTRSLANDVTRSLVWDEGYRRVTGVIGTVNAGKVNEVVKQGDTYRYDAAGRVSSIADGAGLTQCYTYDAANRLSAAWTVAETCGTAAPVDDSWNVSNKPSSYLSSWNYSASGKINSTTSATPSATTLATTKYEYCDTSSPSAVTFTSTAPASQTDVACDSTRQGNEKATAGVKAGSYAYDEAGRMTSRPSPSGVEQTLTWDVLSNLTSIVEAGNGGNSGTTTKYLYDASGQRYAAYNGTTATIYMGAWEATDSNIVTNLASDVSVTRFYAADGVQLASKTGGTLLVTLGDVQGSARVTVDPTGATTSNAYTPYGTERAGSNIASAHGWLNQIADGTGLTYLNARYYDPVLGRFLSPDPLLKPTDPRTLDPYRYADNNPVAYSDASGLNPSCVGTAGLAAQTCWSSYGSIYGGSQSARTYNGYINTIGKQLLSGGGNFDPRRKTEGKSDVDIQAAVREEAKWRTERDERRAGQGAAQNLKDDASLTSAIEVEAGMTAIWSHGATVFDGGPACGVRMECFVGARWKYGYITWGHTIWSNFGNGTNFSASKQAHEYAHVVDIEYAGAAAFYLNYALVDPLGAVMTSDGYHRFLAEGFHNALQSEARGNQAEQLWQTQQSLVTINAHDARNNMVCHAAFAVLCGYPSQSTTSMLGGRGNG